MININDHHVQNDCLLTSSGLQKIASAFLGDPSEFCAPTIGGSDVYQKSSCLPDEHR